MSHDVAIFLKYILMMGHNRKTGVTLINFQKTSSFVGNEQFEARWTQIMQRYIS